MHVVWKRVRKANVRRGGTGLSRRWGRVGGEVEEGWGGGGRVKEVMKGRKRGAMPVEAAWQQGSQRGRARASCLCLQHVKLGSGS